MSLPPPRGMSEADYEAIEAAVTETVRGRRFLAEFARRNRLAETRQLLDAMARLEAAVSGGQRTLPAADPSARLLTHRFKEVAQRLGDLADEMRAAGVEPHFAAAVEAEARAVSGMVRAAPPSPGGKPRPGETPPSSHTPARLLPPDDPAPVSSPLEPRMDRRLAALSELDALPLAEKLALFR